MATITQDDIPELVPAFIACAQAKGATAQQRSAAVPVVLDLFGRYEGAAAALCGGVHPDCRLAGFTSICEAALDAAIAG